MSDSDESKIIWRRLDTPGHESAWAFAEDDGWVLDGCAIFRYDGKPCRLEYLIECDVSWHTAAATVSGWVGDETIDIEIEVNVDKRWTINGEAATNVNGCIDLDLNFSPSTNLLPIRRLNLAVGQAAQVRAAWLRFPGFDLKPLEQTYVRTDESTYRYESDGGRFVREIETDDFGMVMRYPGYWQIETG